MWKRFVTVIGLVAVVVVTGIQFVPYGRNHANPAVRQEPAWDAPRTRQLAVRACYDCHSNQTVWPWYANVAPMSWLVQRDVDKGRRELNFSEFDRRQEEAHEAAESVQKGKMPMPMYAVLHPEARLSDQERAEIIQGLNATLRGRR